MPTDPRLTEAEFAQLDTDEGEPRSDFWPGFIAGAGTVLFCLAAAVGIYLAIH